MSHKSRRRIVRWQKLELEQLVWAGPAVVREQRTVQRVPIVHRGAKVPVTLFTDNDDDGSDGSKRADGVSVVKMQWFASVRQRLQSWQLRR